MKSRCSLAAIALAVLVLSPLAAHAEITLNLLGTYDTGLGEGASEIVTYDPMSQRLFTVNATAATVDIIDISNPMMPSLVSSIDVTGFGAVANSVAVANGVVAVAVEADPAQSPGRVAFYNTNGALLGDVVVASLPDMVTFTPDGTKLLVANEGEPNDAYTVDPQGIVSIVDVSGGIGSATVTNIGFGAFNVGGPRAAELPADVRIFGPNATVAQDLEPEYIAISPDGSTAYVSLQENNAVAIIDIENARIQAIAALGFKDHSLPGNGLDASNRDDAINIANWPVRGMYQPDAIDAFSVGGTNYVISANEGDARDYDGFSEEERMGDLVLDPTAFPNAADLQQDENLGRLLSTTTLGDTDQDGDYDVLYSYGARSFSIWDGTTGALVYDSGDQFEQITAMQIPEIFNTNDDGESFDARSDDKGPEPEAVVVGQVGDRLLAFIGLERVGGIMVYDITDPTAPQFVVYEPSAPGDLSPEGMDFVPAAQSPTGNPLVVVSNEVSGTVSTYQVNEAIGGGGNCVADNQTLCLTNNRFAVTTTWRTSDGGTGSGTPGNLTDDTGTFYFFSETNIEVVVKVLDACDLQGFNSFWVFAGGLTDVEVTMTLTDTESNEVRTYSNALNSPFEPIRDTAAFMTCP
ncbi:MAG: choice-of-anchor I family protein [Acidobacteriota bacterium]